MINVKVRAYASLREHLPGIALGESAEVMMPPEATIGILLDKLGIPRAEVKLCYVSGLYREQGYVLSEGDEVALFPPVGGG
jgi:molybdopterin synthase sulfur carrier subunit